MVHKMVKKMEHNGEIMEGNVLKKVDKMRQEKLAEKAVDASAVHLKDF